MSFRISLHSRFTIWITVLIFVLLGAVLLVVEQREVARVYDELQNRGLLIAQNMASLNYRMLITYDIDVIQDNIQNQINDRLLYVVFYDLFSTPLVYNREIADRKEIYGLSRLQGDVRPDSVYAQTRDVFLSRKIQRVLEVEIPIFVRESQDKWGSVKIGLSLEDMRADIRRTRFVLILIGLGVLLLGLFGATILARRISRPIRKLADGTVRVARGDFGHRITISSQDEIGDLARSFNEMSARLLSAREQMEETQRKLIQAEKLAQIGRLAATIAHEIRNPLTSVKLNIQKVLEDGRLSTLDQEHIGLTQEGIVQIEKFIKELLDYTRVSDLQLAPFPVSQIIDESIKLLSGRFQEKRIAVEKKIDDKLPEILVDGDKMRQVVLNVLRNAVEAVDEGGRVKIAATMAGEGATRRVRIRVSDNGCGIPEKDWDNIFEPFFTTKPSGFGLGLANARKIVEQHKGTIRVVRKRSAGAALEIFIPCEGET
jgi:signal transduction histidine kinase